MAVMQKTAGAAALQRVAPLFANWEETLIWSALEGEMGCFWTLGGAAPKAALCENADFLFLAGAADEPETRLLLERWKAERAGQFIILAPKDVQCAGLIEEVFAGNSKAAQRIAFHKGGEAFDRKRLAAFAHALPQRAVLRRFDKELYALALQEDWSRDFCSQFASAEDYLKRGLGFAALYEDRLIGGASSYTRYSDGIEIQVETRADWQRRGVALACCAALILACIDQHLYPSWDAANEASASLAKKLGYREAAPYAVWELYGKGE